VQSALFVRDQAFYHDNPAVIDFHFKDQKTPTQFQQHAFSKLQTKRHARRLGRLERLQ
jgi:hypothetical protein